MGHYATEMLGDCSQSLETKYDISWLVGDNFIVQTIEEFDATHASFEMHLGGRLEMNPLFAREGKQIYKTRRGAEKAAMKECENKIEMVRAKLLELKHILKVQRPWEDK